MLFTDELIGELEDVLSRPKFTQAILRQNQTVQTLLVGYQGFGEKVSSTTVVSDALRDPKDLMILACAVGGHANYIVTGDKDLLTLGSYRDIPIITPAQFLELLFSDKSASAE